MQAGRLLMRKLISEKMAVPWNEVCLERTPKGKPFLARPAPPSATRSYSFNISHQGDFAVLAAERGLQVGVDIMKTSRPEKQGFLRALKESFIKAVGVGVGFNLQRVEFHISPVRMQEGQVYRHTRMCLDSEEEDPDWVFEESLLDQDHHVAVGLGKMEQSAGSVAHVHKMVLRRTAVQQTQMTKGGVHSLKSNKQDSVKQGIWTPVFVTMR
ncbi:L-aminoadipate-semialdehyde dehydrogenase-phosphopantetheinyl transferase-like [Paramormyrops kingsleyae]|uniref:L-aminoadipate-semialdehyde dehydrogenase-phosphopantetheinyl transferase-like n=1 Tax=Paramormyrops kingsleyae TaxID=1676925 RepID=UPI003B9736C5